MSKQVLRAKFIAGKNLKPYQGLKLAERLTLSRNRFSRKKPKTLSGIETLSLSNEPNFITPEKT
ncbi:hypothetical protein E5S67_02955 [Microcoleus sp. IPMA8]|uniref:Transposase n=1 Tax=Microcoleus asticus IPMA8 TaxID=2563858 RepID=A0ABX2D0N3_9CYAN|nr:hypothetical protein [Microcoleus asticus IPMA8]